MLKIHACVNNVAISSRPFTYPKWLLHRCDILLLNKTVLKFSFYSFTATTAEMARGFEFLYMLRKTLNSSKFFLYGG